MKFLIGIALGFAIATFGLEGLIQKADEVIKTVNK